MWVLVKKRPDIVGYLFYRFSSDETDLYCVATDTLYTTQKYTDEEKLRLSNHNLLKIRGVSFRKIEFTLV